MSAGRGGQSTRTTRKFLVIGNGKYDGSFALKNAVNDADAVAAALARNGFEVTKITDANAQAMLHAALAFGKSLAPDDAGVFYFAGHGVQIDGENYLDLPPAAQRRCVIDGKGR